MKKEYSLKYNMTNIVIKDPISINHITNNRILKNIDKDIKNFEQIIDEKLPHVSKNYFNHNLSTLKVKKSNFLIEIVNYINSSSLAAYYNLETNKIVMSKTPQSKHLSHELLHMSSTLNTEKYRFTGFSYEDYKNDIKLGKGLCEGYTGHLNKKYFVPETNEYQYFRNITELLEFIVGQKTMEKLYFDANLKGLADILEQYSNHDEIYNLIKLVDNLFEISSSKSKLKEAKNIEYFEQATDKITNIIRNIYQTYERKNHIMGKEQQQLVKTFEYHATKLSSYSYGLLMKYKEEKIKYHR